jgi:hypothetical protein
MLPGWHGALDDPSFHEFGIMLEAHAEILFGADKLGDGGHGTVSMIDLSRRLNNKLFNPASGGSEPGDHRIGKLIRTRRAAYVARQMLPLGINRLDGSLDLHRRLALAQVRQHQPRRLH